ncbi:MAG: serine hydrolase [Acidobacteriota bacterium]
MMKRTGPTLLGVSPLVALLCSCCSTGTGVPEVPSRAQTTEKADVLILDEGIRSSSSEYDSDLMAGAGELGARLGRLHALLVVRDNHLLFEKYFNGFDRDREVNVKSVTKTVTAAVLGTAVREGHVRGIDETVGRFFAPELPGDADDRKASITLRHLITMTAGLECASPGGNDQMQDSPDWAGFVLRKRLLHPPGSVFEYSTGNMHLVSIAITRATGSNTFDFARRTLFDPLGITVREWQRDPQGIPHGGNNLYLRPIDMARFGLLFLQKGRYGGRQVLGSEWVDAALSLQYDPGRLWSPFHLNGLGYMWWLFRLSQHDVVAAWGHGGQFIFVVPELRLVVVLASRWEEASTPTPYYRELCRMMEVYVLPAFECRRRPATPQAAASEPSVDNRRRIRTALADP